MASASSESEHPRSHRRPAPRRRVKVRVVTVSGLLLGGITAMHLCSSWLRRHGVPIPHTHFPPALWQVTVVLVVVLYIVFLAVELILIKKAIATVREPELHERYKELMLHWPYALLMVHTVFRSAEPPRAFFGTKDCGVADPPVGSHRTGSQRAPRPGPPIPVMAAAVADKQDPVTREQYRSALAVVIGQLDLLTTDRELLDLLLEKARSLESAADAPPPVDRK